MSRTISADEFNALIDHANKVSRQAWDAMEGHDVTCVIILIGSLLASVEAELGWARSRVLDEICEAADDCVGKEYVQ